MNAFTVPTVPQGGVRFMLKAGEQFTLFDMGGVTQPSAKPKRKKKAQAEIFKPRSTASGGSTSSKPKHAKPHAPKPAKKKTGHNVAVTLNTRGKPNVIAIGVRGGKIVGYRSGKPVYLDKWEAEQAKKNKPKAKKPKAGSKANGESGNGDTGAVDTDAGGTGSGAGVREAASEREAAASGKAADGGTKETKGRTKPVEVAPPANAEEMIQLGIPTIEGEMDPAPEPHKNPVRPFHDDLLPDLVDDEGTSVLDLEDGVQEFPHPEGRKTGLYPHQAEAARRINMAWNEGNGLILQDDAGLGKTLTALAAMVQRQKAEGTKRHMIVVPTGGKDNLIAQWREAAALYGIELTDLRDERKAQAKASGSKAADDRSAVGDGWFICGYDDLYANTKQQVVGDVAGRMATIAHPEPMLDGRWDTVSFDESHNMKKRTSKRTKFAMQFQDTADNVLYMSATPYTNMTDMHYLRKLGMFSSWNEFGDWAEKSGAKVERREGTGEVLAIENSSSPGPMVATAATLHCDGRSLKRMANLEGVTSKFDTVDTEYLRSRGLPAHPKDDTAKANVSGQRIRSWEDILKTGDEVFAVAKEGGYDPSLLRAFRVNWRRKVLEMAKVDRAIELGEQIRERAATPGTPEHDKWGGKIPQIALFTAFKASGWAHIANLPASLEKMAGKIEEKHPFKAQAMRQSAEEIAEIMSTMPVAESPAKRLAEAFGGPDVVAEVHGDTRKKAGKEQDEYQAGRKKTLVATMDKGGTGLSFHDDEGIAPRVQINLTLPFSGAKFVQVSGRSHRLGSQSETEMYWMIADDENEKRNAAIVAKRLRSMGSLVAGDPNVTIDSRALLRFEFGEEHDDDDVIGAISGTKKKSKDDDDDLLGGFGDEGDSDGMGSVKLDAASAKKKAAAAKLAVGDDSDHDIDHFTKYFREFGLARKNEGRDVQAEEGDRLRSKHGEVAIRRAAAAIMGGIRGVKVFWQPGGPLYIHTEAAAGEPHSYVNLRSLVKKAVNQGLLSYDRKMKCYVMPVEQSAVEFPGKMAALMKHMKVHKVDAKPHTLAELRAHPPAGLAAQQKEREVMESSTVFKDLLANPHAKKLAGKGLLIVPEFDPKTGEETGRVKIEGNAYDYRAALRAGGAMRVDHPPAFPGQRRLKFSHWAVFPKQLESIAHSVETQGKTPEWNKGATPTVDPMIRLQKARRALREASAWIG